MYIMSFWKSPPKAKIYEALSAIGDRRVVIGKNRSAEVTSSSGEKKYIVKWSEGEKGITSNDNASYWQGYLGYPILAVLMLRGKVRYDKDVANLLSGIPWKSLNTKFRNNYEKAIEAALDSVEVKGATRERVIDEVDRIWDEISRMRLERLPDRRHPPK